MAPDVKRPKRAFSVARIGRRGQLIGCRSQRVLALRTVLLTDAAHSDQGPAPPLSRYPAAAIEPMQGPDVGLAEPDAASRFHADGRWRPSSPRCNIWSVARPLARHLPLPSTANAHSRMPP